MRIISGIWRGQPLKAPPRIRATTDRVKEAIFSILGEAHDLDVLDLYAGSGALGLEALSRGARRVHFVDISRIALMFIRDNQRGRQNRSVTMAQKDAIAYLGSATNVFDWVFCDPPYERTDYEKLLGGFLKTAALGDQSLLILEMDRFHNLALPPALTLTDQRKFGDTVIYFIRRTDGEPDPADRCA